MVEDARALVDLDEPLDAYGDGVVRCLGCQVAGWLGPAEAEFFPSGMRAQQAALRIHAARQGQGVVALHPLSHPQLRESDALTAVAGLSTLPLGDPARCLAADDLRRVRDRVDVLMLELPLRDAEFVLPTWMELVEPATEARARGPVLHTAGPRPWARTPPI